MSHPTSSPDSKYEPEADMVGYQHTHMCFCLASISTQMPGTTKVITLKIAFLLSPHLPLPPLTCTGRSEPGIQSLSQPLECFFPGRILHSAWIFNMTLLSGNNTQEALLSRSSHESDQQVPEVPGRRGLTWGSSQNVYIL